jgi:hypothetical protein
MSLEALLASGSVAWMILAVIAIEAILLLMLLRGSRMLPLAACGLAAGAFLVLALRAALDDAGAMQIGLFLGLSGVAHACEIALWLRFSGPKG